MPRKDRIDAATVSDAIDYAKFYSRSRDAVISIYDDAGNVIETHEHKGELKEWGRASETKKLTRPLRTTSRLPDS